jgi:vacuolar protein sorting-associated protein 45
MVKNTKKFLNSMFGEDVKNVLLQHKSWLSTSILEPFARGKLDNLQFPSISQGGRQGPSKTLIIFMVGGVTFEEAKEIATFSGAVPRYQQMAGQALGTLQANPPLNPDLILGGTYIHNSKSFLAEVSQFRF